MFNFYAFGLLAAVAGETAVATDVISGGIKLGQLGASAILGVVCVACVCGILKLYKDKQSENKETILTLKTVVEKNTEAIAKNSEIMEDLSKKLP